MAVAHARLEELEARVTWLERTVQELRGGGRMAPAREKTNGLSERERLLADLKAEGLIRDLTPQEWASAERWRALPEEKKKAHIRHMNSLSLDPLLSQIIIENRR
ncbi:MAG: hypothetical protein DRI77_11475 [Chloroflexi bacterium]|nr:MAG: hypothetical protein DRI77_11475 [Chloroflexota bacterium]